jgi:pilus assembly protein CpaB
MRAKSIILLVVALGCGMVAAVAVSKTVLDKGPVAATEEATVEIFVAVKDILTAQRITAENVKLEKWPKSRLPSGAVLKLEELEDKYSVQMIFANEPILKKKISDSRESFATSIPPGYRVFDIACNAGYIKPGDRVDITGTFQLKGKNSTPETRNVLRNVQVIGINGITTRDSDAIKAGSKGTVFQLLVKDSQLEALTTANTLGDLQINLRPLSESLAEKDNSDDANQFLLWLKSSTAEPAPAAEPSPSLFGKLLTSVPSEVKKENPSKQMRIITPEGVKEYEWRNDGELPREVAQRSASSNANATEAVGNPWSSAGNLPSGYGGYTPTYPTSTGTSPSSAGQLTDGQRELE